jgi:hypothetical protein
MEFDDERLHLFQLKSLICLISSAARPHRLKHSLVGLPKARSASLGVPDAGQAAHGAAPPREAGQSPGVGHKRYDEEHVRSFQLHMFFHIIYLIFETPVWSGVAIRMSMCLEEAMLDSIGSW